MLSLWSVLVSHCLASVKKGEGSETFVYLDASGNFETSGLETMDNIILTATAGTKVSSFSCAGSPSHGSYGWANWPRRHLYPFKFGKPQSFIAGHKQHCNLFLEEALSLSCWTVNKPALRPRGRRYLSLPGLFSMQTSWERGIFSRLHRGRGGHCLCLQDGQKCKRLVENCGPMAALSDSRVASSFIDSFSSLLGFTYNCLSQVLSIHGWNDNFASEECRLEELDFCQCTDSIESVFQTIQKL